MTSIRPRAALMSQSTSIGSETTLIPSTSAAKPSPMALPMRISAQPSGVVNTRVKKAPIDGGSHQPNKAR